MALPAYEELDGSPTERVTANGWDIVRVLRCAWADRFTLIDELIGASLTYEGNSSLGALAAEASIEPMPGRTDGTGTGDRVATYTHAQVTVSYKTPSIDFPGEDNGDLIYEELQPNVDAIPVAVRDIIFGENDKAIEGAPLYRWTHATTGDPLMEREAPVKLFPSIDYVWKRFGIASIPASALSFSGHCNVAQITSATLGLTFDAETLLYSGGSVSLRTKTDGTQTFDLEYRFSYRPDTWNKFYRAKTNDFEEIYADGGSVVKVFPTADFTLL